MIIKDFLSAKKAQYLAWKRSKTVYGIQDYFKDSPTIISNNCLAGFIYQDLKMPYCTPTIGLYFFFPDYIDFLKDIKKNVLADIEFVTHSKYEEGNRRLKASKHPYPVGLLDGRMEIHFLHYHSEAEALDKWKRRTERINFDNMIVLGTQLDLCTDNDIEAFDKLELGRKIFLTKENLNYKSSIQLPNLDNSDLFGNPYEKGHLIYETLAKKINSVV